MRRTTPRINTGPIWVVALLALALCVALLAGFSQRVDDSARCRAIPASAPCKGEATGSVDALDGDPAIFVPSPTPQPKPLSLTLDLALPDLDQDQAYWYRQAQIVALGTFDSQNVRTVWLALIWTESRYSPWAVSEIGCVGLGQLCFSLHTPETESDPVANLIASAREFARLVDANGDIMESLRNYKGVQTWDTMDQANSVWTYIRISGK